MEKPIIGVVPLWDNEKSSIWMLPGYTNGIIAAGGIPIILPLCEDKTVLKQAYKLCGGLLFTGGQDVSPEIYGGAKTPLCGETCAMRDNTEMLLLKMSLRDDKPVLGICRGIQFINAALGGTLYDDIPARLPSKLTHCQKPPYHIPSHSVNIDVNSPLYTLLKTDKLSVNSYHHQGVNKLSEHLRTMAQSDDGLVEAVYMPDKRFVWAVQWHPEMSYQTDDNSLKIFKEFITQTQMPRESQTAGVI